MSVVQEQLVDPAPVAVDVDLAISNHVFTIRDRFGPSGLVEAQRLIASEIAVCSDAYGELVDLQVSPADPAP